MWSCPHCRQVLQQTPGGKTLVCENGHSFDRAREGYVNLLPANRKRSREPGDDPRMIDARRRVHESGAYQRLADALVEQLTSLLVGGAILDLGCGEGYYSAAMASALPGARVCGIDISRAAVRLAARRHSVVSFAVASAYQIPLPDASLDAVVRIFAPSDDAEVIRVLRPGQYYLEISPAPGHLWQLRERLYDKPRAHPEARVPIAGMQVLRQQVLEYELPLSPALLDDIIGMTPYAHRGHREKRESLRRDRLKALTMAFSLHLYRCA